MSRKGFFRTERGRKNRKKRNWKKGKKKRGKNGIGLESERSEGQEKRELVVFCIFLKKK
jgi:hypothetical protein